MTLRGVWGVACDANFLFVCCFLFVNYYQTLESGRFTDQTTVAMSHNKQLIDTVPKGV